MISGTEDFKTYEEALSDNEDLKLFMRNVRKFDTSFCDMVTAGTDFTIRLEVRGNQGRLVHCRVDYNEFDRPKNLPIELAKKSN